MFDPLFRVQTLVHDNLRPALNIWRDMSRDHGGQKLTMRHFFRTAARMKSELVWELCNFRFGRNCNAPLDLHVFIFRGCNASCA